MSDLDFGRYEHWHSYKAATRGLAKSNLANDPKYHNLIGAIKIILLNWHRRWSGQSAWQSFLNKDKLLHELEESIVALLYLQRWIIENYDALKESKDSGLGLTVVDLCSGKGVFSMLLTYLAALDDNGFKDTFRVISRIVMVDRMKVCNWFHIDVANEDVINSTNSDVRSNFNIGTIMAKVPIEIWSDTNIHEESILNRLRNEISGRVAIIGIHLCKNLSPRAIGITNICGQSKVPFLCLAPCCLPRLTAEYLCVPIFENDQDRIEREAIQLRRRRLKWKKQKLCSLCNALDSHFVRNCPLLPSNERERDTILQQHQLCWNCGKLGHGKDFCNDSKPPSVTPPSVTVDLLAVKNAASPFDEYCQRLVKTISALNKSALIERRLSTVKLEGNSGHNQPSNLIGQRKCTWLTFQCRV